MNKKTILLTGLLLLATFVQAQQALTINECRERALQNNRGLKQAELKHEETDALEKMALMQMLPKVSANGGYMWMEKSVNLLSEDQKNRLNTMGSSLEADINASLHEQLSGVPLVGDALAERLSNVVSGTGIGDRINGIGNEIVQGLETDTRNMGFGVVTLTQPIYMGGKLVAAYRTARLMDELNGIGYDKEREATLVAVDEAYWQVVSVQHKQRLAEQYAALLDTLERNVELAVEAEVATKGDLAKVRVKRNEAQMSLTKANNGLRLSKMLLAQRCGMPLDTVFEVSDEFANLSSTNDQALTQSSIQAIGQPDMQDVYARRAEMRMLRIGDSIAREGVRIAASTLKPNVAFTGGYLFSNPNVFDGFSNNWGGTWMAGVAVNVPLVHPGGIFAVKAAKAKQKEAQYKRMEAEELIELQVNKLSCELELAYKRLDEAESNIDMANKNLELADESFKAGLCNSSDVMAAQTAWMQARSEAIDAHIDIEMNKVYLKQALGK